MMERLEIQYAKKTTLKVELLGLYKSEKGAYANIKCSMLVNDIPIAETTRALEVDDTLEFSNHQAIANSLSYEGLTPLIENIEMVKKMLSPPEEVK
jgi:hypothetical protein